MLSQSTHTNFIMLKSFNIIESAATSAQIVPPSLHNSTAAQQRLTQSKCTDSSRSQLTVSNSRAAPPNNSTFSIKYRNPKFVESPSLEVLVKEESSSLRCQTAASHMGSLSSMPTDEGHSSARHSQSSQHSVLPKKNVSSEGLIK